MPDAPLDKSVLRRLEQVAAERRRERQASVRRRQHERELVLEALDLHISKAEIGRRLDVTRQAVEQLAAQSEQAA